MIDPALMALLLAVAGQGTDFGVRTAPGWVSPQPSKQLAQEPFVKAAFDLTSAAALGRKWGTVTSTRRTPARNRAVGGVANSFHLSGRAIDIARRGGIRHSQIEAAFRQAGYHLVESLDEGDHSHFAFGTPRRRDEGKSEQSTIWKVIRAPGSR
ncbi:MAG TPA: D-Ala-D-Ala carboxypeptidase family metallohydrolase [Allosphingosinicella sp.]|uniref:D-Ala-D-Ala carboxypeptidase family metallohydrolase n=1 Tax=Allosphingosinicella sp. TaxID=2823234 RepID=UPI002ED846BC